MLYDTNREELLRITQTLNCKGCRSTSFEFNGYVFEIVRLDHYLEQHYKKIPYKEN